jgi:hypothetical protein
LAAIFLSLRRPVTSGVLSPIAFASVLDLRASLAVDWATLLWVARLAGLARLTGDVPVAEAPGLARNGLVRVAGAVLVAGATGLAWDGSAGAVATGPVHGRGIGRAVGLPVDTVVNSAVVLVLAAVSRVLGIDSRHFDREGVPTPP